MDRHIDRLQAKILYLLIRASSSSLPPPPRDDEDNNIDNIDLPPPPDLSYEVRRQINAIEQEIVFAMRQKLNFERLRQIGGTRIWTAERYTYVNNYNIIRYLSYGPQNSDNTLILLHGLGASAERWGPIIPTLLSAVITRGYRIIIPDIIGFGYSDKPTVEYTMDFLINDFLRPFLDKLQISKASIVGSSFGGHLATEFAIRSSDRVDRLILISPAGMMRASNLTLQKYVEAACEPKYQRVYEAFREMVYDPSVVTQGMVMDFINIMKLPNALHAFMSTLYNLKYAPDLRNRLSDITAPTLILWGENDSMIPLRYSTYYNGIPNAIMSRLLVVIEECSHLVPVEKPTKLGKIIAMCLRPLE